MGNRLIKLVQRKRIKEEESQYVDNESPIFKLNGHCFDELLDYLSLKDLHSLGLTCKVMQQITGKFFKHNYSATNFFCLSDGIYMIYHECGTNKCIPIPGFIQFVTSIDIGNNCIKNFRSRKNFFHNDQAIKFMFIKLHADKLKSVKKLTLTNVCVNKKTVNCILNILPNIEVLQLRYSTVNGDFYDVLLKYCTNVRRIHLNNVTFKNHYKWLLRQYEKLEHLDLVIKAGVSTLYRLDELCTFFERNPSVRSFSCNIFTLWFNKDALLNSKVKLDTFELKYTDYWHENMEVWHEHPISWDFVHQFHANGFYKCLHIYGDVRMEHFQLPETLIFEKLFVTNILPKIEWLSTHFIKCNEIGMLPSYILGNENFLKDVMNVERLYFDTGSVDILLLIQRLKNLRKIKVIDFDSETILELDMLNTEREKLAGARKVTIYVPDEIYLATKWATKNGTTNFNLIEMKRVNSYEWEQYEDDRTIRLRLRKKKKNSQVRRF